MGSTNRFFKDPDAIVDYGIAWAAWLVLDTIATSTWTVPTGITKVSDTFTTTQPTIWLSGGTIGVEYILDDKIVTAGGRTKVFRIYVRIEEP